MKDPGGPAQGTPPAIPAARPPGSRQRPLAAATVALTVIALALGVGAFEWRLRRDYAREMEVNAVNLRKEWPSLQVDAYRAIYSDERARRYRFAHHPNVNLRLERGIYEFTMVTNGEGLREARDYDALERSAIFLGDSVAEGASVENQETMDSVFERETGLTALNFGVGSRGTLLAVEHLRGRYRRAYRTSLVVHVYCPNDLVEAGYIRYFEPRVGIWYPLRPVEAIDLGRGVGRLEDVPLLGAAADTLVRGMRESRLGLRAFGAGTDAKPHVLPYRSTEATPTQIELETVHFRRLARFVGGLDARLVVAFVPSKTQLESGPGPGGRVQDVVMRILDAQGIPYVDLHGPLADAMRARPEERWYHDELHPYKPGHALIGRHLADVLRQRFPEVFGAPGRS